MNSEEKSQNKEMESAGPTENPGNSEISGSRSYPGEKGDEGTAGEDNDLAKGAISTEDLIARYEVEIEELKKENRSLEGKLKYVKGQLKNALENLNSGAGKVPFMEH